MKLSGFTKLGMGATGLLLVVWCVLMLVSSGRENKSRAVVTDDNRCPDCGRVLPKGAKASGECPFCTLEKGPEAVKASRERRQGGLASSPTIPIVLASVFGLLLVTHLFIALRRRVGKNQEEPVYFYVCPQCGRRLRYRQHQVRHAGKCPLCKRLFVFPPPPNDHLRGRTGLLDSVRQLFSRGARSR